MGTLVRTGLDGHMSATPEKSISYHYSIKGPNMYGTETHIEVVEQEANQQQIKKLKLVGAEERQISPLSEVYRHSWGRRRGEFIANLTNWNAVRPDSLVFVSVGEGLVDGDPTAGKFIGNAKFTVNNVSPENGNVRVWVTIAFDQPIVLFIDYLLIPQ
jgi:hypothetical protein